jgi:hypothetical protein
VSIAIGPDYSRQHILSHIKPMNVDSDGSLKLSNKVQVLRALQSVRRTAALSAFCLSGLLKNAVLN